MPENGLDVPACVQRVLRGDDDAARDLLNHLHPLVLKLVRAHLPRRSSEDDLVQTVFMKVFAKLDRFSGRVPLEHWVSRIAVNTCLNQIRSENLRPELRWADLSEEEEHVLSAVISGTEAAAPAAGLAARELVHKLLAHLNPADRLVINLVHLEGRSVAETSRLTGMNAALVKIRAFRARVKMKRHLQALLKEHTP